MSKTTTAERALNRKGGTIHLQRDRCPCIPV